MLPTVDGDRRTYARRRRQWLLATSLVALFLAGSSLIFEQDPETGLKPLPSDYLWVVIPGAILFVVLAWRSLKARVVTDSRKLDIVRVVGHEEVPWRTLRRFEVHPTPGRQGSAVVARPRMRARQGLDGDHGPPVAGPPAEGHSPRPGHRHRRRPRGRPHRDRARARSAQAGPPCRPDVPPTPVHVVHPVRAGSTPVPYDALLLVSFGGPEGPDDVIPFLEHVLRGRNVPRRRLEQVAGHYLRFGGVSPDQRAEPGPGRRPCPRSWPPWPISISRCTGATATGTRCSPTPSGEMAGDGVRRALAFVTSAYALLQRLPPVPRRPGPGPRRGRTGSPGRSTSSGCSTTTPGSSGPNAARLRAALDQAGESAARRLHRPQHPPGHGGDQRLRAQLRTRRPGW